MMSLIKHKSINVTVTVNVAGDNPEAALQKVIDTDTRIIIANFDYRVAMKTMCMVSISSISWRQFSYHHSSNMLRERAFCLNFGRFVLVAVVQAFTEYGQNQHNG